MTSITIDSESGKFINEPADRAAMMSMSSSALSVADAYANIDSAEMRALALDDMTKYRNQAKALEEKRSAITRPLDAAKQAVMDLFRTPVDGLKDAANRIQTNIVIYDTKVREQREAERRKAEAEAAAARRIAEEREAAERKAAAEAQAKLDAEIAEQRRKQEEIIAAAEAEARRAAEQAAAAARSGDIEAQREAEEMARQNLLKAQEEARKAQEESEALEKARQLAEFEAAERIRLAAASSAVIATPAAAAKEKGVRVAWKAKCNDKMALVKFIANNPAFINLIDVNESALNQLAKAQKDAMKIDGCMAYEDRTVVANRKSA